MFIWYIASLFSGFFFGWLFSHIFKKFLPSGFSRRYWISFGQNIDGLFRGDEDQFWRYYRAIVVETLRYAGTQLLGVFLALSPLMILMIMISPVLQSTWNADSPVKIYPNHAGLLTKSSDIQNRAAQASPPPKAELLTGDQPLVLVLNSGYKVNFENGLENNLVCPPDSFKCFLLRTFGFTTFEVPREHLGGLDAVIVRAYHNDFNPLWPYLNDLEFLFFISLSISSLLLLLRKGGKKASESPTVYNINPVDYILTLIASRYPATMRKIGDWETRRNASKLGQIRIVQPIFVTGLARAGTTIILETLSTADDVATHRYKDFPFIMAPILWNFFTSIFAKKQPPIERPHKDRIKITRESPDAFEEPLWHHFFPFVHDPESLHRLGKEVNNSTFENFFCEHIKKILFIRRGNRYLSKGNYNISRIEYINSFLADAKFIIPIRHPLSHVESLMRQHALFMEYTDQNPQVAEYLKAVGHYEFGPQRIPICLTPDGRQRILAAWKSNNDYLGYAIQWAEIYRYVAELYSLNSLLARQMHFVRYEDLCRDPKTELQIIVSFLELSYSDSIREAEQNISPPSKPLGLSEKEIDLCWQEVADIAGIYGYTSSVDKIESFSQASLKMK